MLLLGHILYKCPENPEMNVTSRNAYATRINERPHNHTYGQIPI